MTFVICLCACTTGSTHCFDCEAGKYSAAVGATAVDTCSDCGAGKFSLAGASVCTNCGAGTYSAAGASICTICAAGTYLMYPAYLVATASSWDQSRQEFQDLSGNGRVGRLIRAQPVLQVLQGMALTPGSQFHMWAGRPQLRFSGAVAVFRRRLQSAA